MIMKDLVIIGLLVVVIVYITFNVVVDCASVLGNNFCLVRVK